MYPSIDEGAIFISDVHYSSKNKGLEKFIDALLSKKITPSQIFWMGDIFDLLVGGVGISIEKNKNIIEKINTLEMNQYYFEGNHDFNVKKIFPKMVVVPRSKQPMIFEFQGKKTALAHGDIFTPKLHNLYFNTISNRWVILLLNALNINGWITTKIDNYNDSKNLSKKIKHFDTIVDMRMKEYQKFGVEIVIEGHFHQNRLQKIDNYKILYLNLPAYACSQSFFIVKSNDDRVFVEHFLRSDDG